MSDIDTVLNAVRLATAEALSGALGKAKKDLDNGADQLKAVLADIERGGASHAARGDWSEGRR